ncbi:penicillin-binding protein 1A [Nitratireductor sp. L1-7-SE]|uniref:peptidoglycan glycosyltransferase n=1 Tax=Nitratireductor rhodophyticola TaxID=2854036 RepID=A0ABS7RAX6_9HYPH|nr:penicillin-binding protein 1A [Nitratireductor rhodophyticola]MBY8918079.1 penicillin-binding protein 1A [Nitratireductor rhodophyticola]MBY8921112.1 penicillin-binding protein 1A [Nitratireductor rhodophyticola]
MPREKRQSKAPRATRLLALDAWIDSTLYEAGFKLAELWESVTIFFRRFRVYGARRAVVEIFSEGATLGAVGSVVMLALAMPAFEETAGDWRAQDDYAVTFLDRYGNEIGQRGIIQRDSVPVDELPDHVIKAVLATEDRRFFNHFGIDFLGLARALTENVRANSVVQGGSTLTQQLAKNLFLSNERTLERKVKEAFLSIWLEMNLSKTEILQYYLDRSYLGGGTFGISAAADFYFDKPVKDLSLSEAAMIAGLFKAPARYAPHVNLPAARARANEVLTNMVQAGFMSEGQILSARLHPATAVDRDGADTPDYFLDWAFEEVKRVVPRSATHSLVARTTLDPNLQKAAEESLEFHLRQYGKDYDVSEGAIVLMDTEGAVRAIVGGRDYGASQFNRATKAERQTGSSFKPYVYAVAMENGFDPDSVISDGPISWGSWSPRNYGRSYAGRVTLTRALIKSYNTVPVRLARDHLGIDPIISLIKSFGIESPLNGHKTMVLGTSGMTALDQATGYSVFANGGYADRRFGIVQMMTHSGNLIYDHGRDAPPPRRVLSQKAAASMNQMLILVPEQGTGRRAALPMTRSAGKTGTTQSYRDGWYVGYTGNYVASVWLGNDDFHATRRMTGGSLPAMVWQRLMAYAHQNVEIKPLPGIEGPMRIETDAVETASEEGAGDRQESETLPLALSARTSLFLKGLSKDFEAAPRLRKPASNETLSAL